MQNSHLDWYVFKYQNIERVMFWHHDSWADCHGGIRDQVLGPFRWDQNNLPKIHRCLQGHAFCLKIITDCHWKKHLYVTTLSWSLHFFVVLWFGVKRFSLRMNILCSVMCNLGVYEDFNQSLARLVKGQSYLASLCSAIADMVFYAEKHKVSRFM